MGGDIWTTGVISRAKFQSNHHHQQTNIQCKRVKSFNKTPHPGKSKCHNNNVPVEQSLRLGSCMARFIITL